MILNKSLEGMKSVRKAKYANRDAKFLMLQNFFFKVLRAVITVRYYRIFNLCKNQVCDNNSIKVRRGVR